MRSSSVSSPSRSSGSSQLNGASSLIGPGDPRTCVSAACDMADLLAARSGRLWRGQHDLALHVVDGHGIFQPLDLGLGAVTLGDHLLPLRRVELLGRLPGFPDVDPAALAVAEHVILRDQAGYVA